MSGEAQVDVNSTVILRPGPHIEGALWSFGLKPVSYIPNKHANTTNGPVGTGKSLLKTSYLVSFDTKR